MPRDALTMSLSRGLQGMHLIWLTFDHSLTNESAQYWWKVAYSFAVAGASAFTASCQARFMKHLLHTCSSTLSCTDLETHKMIPQDPKLPCGATGRSSAFCDTLLRMSKAAACLPLACKSATISEYRPLACRDSSPAARSMELGLCTNLSRAPVSLVANIACSVSQTVKAFTDTQASPSSRAKNTKYRERLQMCVIWPGLVQLFSRGPGVYQINILVKDSKASSAYLENGCIHSCG